ncbi:prolipoprotein diacylglyceryl transferase family protein, partial [Intestinibacter sp.]|uniref:prolipoprotein diacylglyceryl transferase family protein n=1 Tax=Intestinibacter sp. TaxID=1965304 RepID=UPI003F14BDDA
VDGVKVHPTFLYESIWDLGVFLFLFIFRKKQKYQGQILVDYIVLYSIGRFFIEGLRTDSLMLGPLRMAQVISLACIIVGVILNYILSRRAKNNI